MDSAQGNIGPPGPGEEFVPGVGLTGTFDPTGLASNPIDTSGDLSGLSADGGSGGVGFGDTLGALGDFIAETAKPISGALAQAGVFGQQAQKGSYGGVRYTGTPGTFTNAHGSLLTLAIIGLVLYLVLR